MALASGARLGPYEVVAQIGAGGMGEVYRARDTRLDRLVAIKVLPPDVAENPLRRDRFEREARIISNLNHPYICTLYDVGHPDGVAYLVMELIDGQTLADRLARGALPLQMALECAIQIAQALDHWRRQMGRRSRLRRLVQLRIVAAFAMIVSVSGCGHEPGAPTSPSSSTVRASAVVVSGTAPFIGTTAQFVATATLSNSASQSVTTQAAWSSSNTTIATVSSDGTVTGVAAGDVDITATYQNVAGHVHVTITSVPNYQGVWRGDYSATACDGVNGLCSPGDLGVGSVHSFELNLMQNGTMVTGYMSIGLGLPVVSGRVDGNGHLVLSGTWSCGCGLGSTKYTGTISDFDAVVAGSSMSGHWTMTFTSVLSTDPSGTAQVVIQTLTRN